MLLCSCLSRQACCRRHDQWQCLPEVRAAALGPPRQHSGCICVHWLNDCVRSCTLSLVSCRASSCTFTHAPWAQAHSRLWAMGYQILFRLEISSSATDGNILPMLVYACMAGCCKAVQRADAYAGERSPRAPEQAGPCASRPCADSKQSPPSKQPSLKELHR